MALSFMIFGKSFEYIPLFINHSFSCSEKKPKETEVNECSVKIEREGLRKEQHDCTALPLQQIMHIVLSKGEKIEVLAGSTRISNLEAITELSDQNHWV